MNQERNNELRRQLMYGAAPIRPGYIARVVMDDAPASDPTLITMLHHGLEARDVIQLCGEYVRVLAVVNAHSFKITAPLGRWAVVWYKITSYFRNHRAVRNIQHIVRNFQ